jgi:Protein of unknown function (DUF3443)
MMRSFAVLGFFATALAAACSSSPHPQDGAAPSRGGKTDGASAPDSAGDVGRAGSDASLFDVASAGGTGGAGGATATGTGGAGGSDTGLASGGVSASDGPPASAGTSPTDGPPAAGGADARNTRVATGGTGAGGTAGTTAAGTGTAGRTGGSTATAGTSGIAGSADNVAEVVVDNGIPGIGYLNGLFATVTVCVPGTSQCQDIAHVLVDTGSVGLRLLGSVLTLSLPVLANDSGVALAQCTQFVSGFTWGPLRSADFKIAGEQVSNLAIQVIEESSYPVPSNCTGLASNSADTLGANGILGVGSFLQDCGSACAAPIGARSANPGLYYACSSTKRGGCVAAAVPVAKQLSNPVVLFSQDNNGVIIELPAIAASGAASVPGSLVFGIGTRDNNGLGQETVIPLDQSATFLTKYPASGKNALAFVDSGSNAIYFLDSKTTSIPTCSGMYSLFYCPRSTMSLSATSQDAGGSMTVAMTFSIANALTLFSSKNNVAFANVGGTGSDSSSGSSGLGSYFDWGLPFFFGKNVFSAIEGQSTPAGKGPFVAF